MAEKLFQNLYKVELETENGFIDCSKQVPLPIKWNSLLDEQLDEAAITLQRSNIDVIYPLTKVRITIWNEEMPDQKIEHVYIVTADDSQMFYSPELSEYRYTHELSLIEETKYLEGFICRSQGYVNSLGRIYIED